MSTVLSSFLILSPSTNSSAVAENKISSCGYNNIAWNLEKKNYWTIVSISVVFFLTSLLSFLPSFFLFFVFFLLLLLICKYICMFVTWFVHTCTYMIHAFLCLVLENAPSPACSVKSSSFHLVSLKSLQGQGSYLCLSIILLRAQHLAHCHVLSIVFTKVLNNIHWNHQRAKNTLSLQNYDLLCYA